MDGELAIGKLSETNLYFKLSPYLLLGKAPSEWFLPNNLIGNLISWLYSLTTNKYSFEYQYIVCFGGAVQYEYLHIKYFLDTYLCHKIIWSLLPSNIWSNYNSPAPRHFVTLTVYQGVENYPKCCVFLRFLVFQISALFTTSLLLPSPFVRLSWA